MDKESLMNFLGIVDKQSNTELSQEGLNDIVLLANNIEKHVANFLISNNMAKPDSSTALGHIMPASESLTASAIEYDTIKDLVNECNIGPVFENVAVKEIGTMLHRAAGTTKQDLFYEQNYTSEDVGANTQIMDIDSLYSSDLATLIDGSSLESFGINIDSAIPDMKMAITVAIMKYHTAITERWMPTRPTTQPFAWYLRDNLELVDTSDKSKVTKLVDLYADPSPMDNELKSILVRKVNDSEKIIEDGVIKNKVSLNMIEAALDPKKPNLLKADRTDTVSSDVKIDSVYCVLNDGKNPAETFKITIPSAWARLSRTPNSQSTADRLANIEYTTFLTQGAETSNGQVSKILKVCTTKEEGIAVTVTATPKINLISSVVQAFLNVEVKAHHLVDPSKITKEVKDMVKAVNDNTPDAIGYSMIAKYSEDNFRQSQRVLRTNRTNLAYGIPGAPNLVYEYAINQQNAETNASYLAKTISIGKDFRNIKIVEEVMDSVYNANMMNKHNPLSQYDVGSAYIAGSKVKPYVIKAEFDAKPSHVMRDSDRSGDIKQKALDFLTHKVEELHANSFFTQQLPAGSQVVYKLVTSNEILGDVLGQPHIHNNLDKSEYGDPNGVEYRLVLTNGVVMEVVTSTFNVMKNRMLITASVPGAPASDLNFGHNWSYGLLVGAYTKGSDGVRKRLFANSRTLLVPTCPVGMEIVCKNVKPIEA